MNPNPMNARRDWVVLRCANASTLRLAESLNAAGIEAWSPVDVSMTGKDTEARSPLLPSFVFALAEHLAELFDLSNSWNSPHPGFWIMRPFGNIAFVSESQLAPLRNIERKRKPRGKVKLLEVGAMVRLSEGGFEGLTGRIDRVQGKFAMVAFDRFIVPVKIGMWLLSEDLDAAPDSAVSSEMNARRALRHRNADKVPGANSPCGNDRFRKCA